MPLFEEVLKRQEATLNRHHPRTQATVANLGVNYKDAGRFKEALPRLEEARLATRKNPALQQWVGLALMDGYLRAGKPQQAHVLAKEMLDDIREASPKDSQELAGNLALLALDDSKDEHRQRREMTGQMALGLSRVELIQGSDYGTSNTSTRSRRNN